MYKCKESFQLIPSAKGMKEIYNRLYQYFGPQYWWPGDTPFEIIIGAILTQAVSWRNVEKAINNLKGEELLSPIRLDEINEEKLAQLIRPAGYYNLKAKRIKAFINFLVEEYDGSLDTMFAEPLVKLRPRLLNIYGIGPETADSILLYAGGYPIFVIDAYTKRIFSRITYVSLEIKYHDLQKKIMDNLPEDVEIFNEYHALLVALGKNICKKNNPLCDKCPLVNSQLS